MSTASGFGVGDYPNLRTRADAGGDLLVWSCNQRAGAESRIKEADKDAGLAAYPAARREHAKELFVPIQDNVPCLLTRSGASHQQAGQQEAQADFGFWILDFGFWIGDLGDSIADAQELELSSYARNYSTLFHRKLGALVTG